MPPMSTQIHIYLHRIKLPMNIWLAVHRLSFSPQQPVKYKSQRSMSITYNIKAEGHF